MRYNLSSFLQLMGYLKRQRAAITPSEQDIGAAGLDFANQLEILTSGLLDRAGEVFRFDQGIKQLKSRNRVLYTKAL